MPKYMGIVTIVDYQNMETTSFAYNAAEYGHGKNVFEDRDELENTLYDFIEEQVLKEITATTSYESIPDAAVDGDLDEYDMGFYFSPTMYEINYKIIELNEEDE
jgi:hypothetical protein